MMGKRSVKVITPTYKGSSRAEYPLKIALEWNRSDLQLIEQ